MADPALRPRALAVLQTFLAAGGDPDTLIRYHHGMAVRVLLASADSGWIEGTSAVIAAGADVHADRGRALAWAANNGHRTIVERLLAAGADVHACDDLALRWAANNNHHAIVTDLLAAGANVHACADAALYGAILNGHLPVAERLLAAGADVMRAVGGTTAIQCRRLLASLDTRAAAIPIPQRPIVLCHAHGAMPLLAALVHAHRRATQK